MLAPDLRDIARLLQELAVDRDHVRPEVLDELRVHHARQVLVGVHDQERVRLQQAEHVLAVVLGDVVPGLVLGGVVVGRRRNRDDEEGGGRERRDEAAARHADTLRLAETHQAPSPARIASGTLGRM